MYLYDDAVAHAFRPDIPVKTQDREGYDSFTASAFTTLAAHFSSITRENVQKRYSAASLLYEVACATGVISLKFESVTTFVRLFPANSGFRSHIQTS